MSDLRKWKLEQAPDTEIHLARVPPTQIGFINSIIEGYEGIGIVRTRDPKMGILEFWMIPDFREVFLNVIGDLQKEIDIVWIPRSERDRTFGIVDGKGYSPNQSAS